MQSTASPIRDAIPQIAVNIKTPVQTIQVLSISNVKTRRISTTTEHLAMQIIKTERISEANTVYGKVESAQDIGASDRTVCTWPGGI
jgi:hypothetical protein